MKKTILALCCVAALASCKKTAGPEGPQGATGPQGPAGPAGNTSTGTGIITGNVKQYDQYSVAYTTGLNTTTVGIEGSTVTTVTDASGNYTLTNLAAGVYDLTYTKSGNGLSKQQQIVLPGAGTLYMGANVFDKPTFTINSGYIKDTVISGNHTQRLNISFAPDTKKRNIMLVYGTSNVDLADPASYVYALGINLNPGNTSYSTSFSYPNTVINSFPSGSTVYVKIYPVSGQSSAYYNYFLNKEVYTAYGTPMATTFAIVMP